MILLIFIHSAVLLWCSQAIMFQSYAEATNWIFQNQIGFWLALLMVAAIGLLIFGITQSAVLSQIPATIILDVLTLISYYKCVYRGEPLELADFSLISQFGSIVKYVLEEFEISFVTLSSLLIPIALLIVFYIVKKNEKKKTSKPEILIDKIVPIALSVIIIVEFAVPLSLGKIVTNIGAKYSNQQERSIHLSTGLGLYASLNLRRQFDAETEFEENVDFREIDRRELTDYFQNVKSNKPCNIILILSESFFDITHMPNLSFSKDPIPNFHKLQENCTNGTFYTDNFAGGTGYVEMEVLTGISRFFLREGDTLTSLGDKTENIPSIVSNLKSLGYSTVAMHSHTNELYERETNFKKLGFDKLVFRDDFEVKKQVSGDYISDDSFADEIIYLFENKEKDKPLFLYGISMENHFPYSEDKYSTESIIKADSNKLNEKEIKSVESYVTGLNHEDAALQKLIDYFHDQEEPVVIAYFGDHLPYLSSEDEYIYSKLGYCSSADSGEWTKDELKKIHSSEYIIWSNDNSISIDDKNTGSCFLGLELLKACNIPLCSYFKMLDENVANKILLYRSRLFIDKLGNTFDDVPGECMEAFDYAQKLVRAIIYPASGERSPE